MSWKVLPSGPLKGTIDVPGDKSITHRGYILGALASGNTVVRDPLRAHDTDSTLNAVASLGVKVERKAGSVLISGGGLEGLSEPEGVLDLGNAGTGVRLMAGLLASCPFFTTLTGDASLRSRPMGRIVAPLRDMGAVIDGRKGGSLLPLSIRGGGLRAIEFTSPVASAQVKSCVLIAALSGAGETSFTEPALSRDHTERLLEYMGASLKRADNTLIIAGGQSLDGCDISVPGDISSAAFFLVAASVLEGSSVTLRRVGVNPTRTGLLDLLRAMGTDVVVDELPDEGPEPMADITVKGGGSLVGIDVPEEWIPSIIDELPLVAVAAAAARGKTVIRGAKELRVKESDRIASTVNMLDLAGVSVTEAPDGFVVEGGTGVKSADFTSHSDHRIAMASAVLTMMADSPGTVRDTDCVATSFPDFVQRMNSLAPGSITVLGEKSR